MGTITVLNVVPDERFGGPQHRILRVAERLKDADVNTIVVMPQGDKTYTQMLLESNIPFYQLRSFRRLPNPSNLVGIVLWFFYFIPCIISLPIRHFSFNLKGFMLWDQYFIHLRCFTTSLK